MEKDGIKDFLDALSDKNRGIENKVPKQKYKKTNFFKQGLFALVFLACLIFLIYFGKVFYTNFNLKKLDDKSYLVSKVSQLVEVPGELPVIVTVTNSDILNKQIFFRDAKVGDKLLIFGVSKKAILYRPSTNRVISIAPIN